MCVRGRYPDGLEGEPADVRACVRSLHRLRAGAAKGKIDTKVLSCRARYREVEPNLRVKEVVLGDGERRERYAVCQNLRETRLRRRHRAGVLAESEAKLTALSSGGVCEQSRQMCRLHSSHVYGYYLLLTRRGKFRIHRAEVKAAERLDGKFVVHTNDDTQSAAFASCLTGPAGRVPARVTLLFGAERARPPVSTPSPRPSGAPASTPRPLRPPPKRKIPEPDRDPGTVSPGVVDGPGNYVDRQPGADEKPAEPVRADTREGSPEVIALEPGERLDPP